MANKSIIKKLKGLFTMSENKEKKADTGSADANAGFEVLNDEQPHDPDLNGGVLGESPAIEEEPTDEAPMAPDDISENVEDEAPEPCTKAEKTHEKVTRIAAEMNTKGYGL